MFKTTALTMLMLSALAAPPVWGQDDPDSDAAEMQADDEADQGEESGDEADADEFADEADADESYDEEASADEADVPDEEEDASSDSSDAGDLADETGDAAEEDADPATGLTDDEIVPVPDDGSGMRAATPAPTTPPQEGTEPVAQTPPAPPAPPTVPQPPAAPSGCRCANRVSMRIPSSNGLFGMRIPTSKATCSDRQSGTVKWFNDAKCFGFITPESGQDLFVHYCDIQSNGFKSLKEGQQVTFKVVQGPKGLKAAEVQAL